MALGGKYTCHVFIIAASGVWSQAKPEFWISSDRPFAGTGNKALCVENLFTSTNCNVEALHSLSSPRIPTPRRELPFASRIKFTALPALLNLNNLKETGGKSEADGMWTFISFLLVILAVIIAVPVTVFFVEVIAAVALPQRNDHSPSNGDFRPRVGVLVPAHNESVALLPTLTDIKSQLRTNDRLLVVADNCVDDTAAVATAAGAEVMIRNDPDRRGKGYALAWGVRHLSTEAPDIVIIVDADCRLPDLTIERLATVCAAARRPVQALYLMVAQDKSPINSRVAEFAWRVKNWVRPLGLKALGLPCQLMGTGMAFPWDVICQADLASGSIVEDLKLGLDLTLAGHPPLFCVSAKVTSDFASSNDGIQSQRLRWEGGHFAMILTAAPRLICLAILRRNFRLLALALDLAVPPLSLLALLVTGMSAVVGLAALVGASCTAMWICIISLGQFLAGVFVSWLKYGRDILPPSATLQVILYVARKLPLYRQILSGKSASQWIRTDRSKF